MKNRASTSALVAALVAAAWPAAAQETTPGRDLGVQETGESLPSVAPSKGPSRRVTLPPEPTAAQQGPYKVGSFRLYPELVIMPFYDSNVFYTNSPRNGDGVFLIAPTLWLQSDWEKHALNFQAGADFTRYDTYDSEDTTDWRVSAEGRYDLDIDSNVYGGVRYARDHEDRESPDFRNGIVPTRYMNGRGYAGYFRQMQRWSVRVAGSAQQLDYEDVPFITGGGNPALINNDDRDRWQYTGGVRVGYEASPRLEPFVQVSVDARRYDESPDDLGFARDSDGLRALAGVRYNLPRQMKAEGYVGYLSQDYDDARFSKNESPAFGGTLQWQASDRLRVSAYLDRTIEESTVIQNVPVLAVASSYLNTYLGVGAGYRLSRTFTLQANASYSNLDYKGIDRDDDYMSGGFGVIYRHDPRMIVHASFLHRNLRSSVAGEDYDKNQFFVRLAFPL